MERHRRARIKHRLIVASIVWMAVAGVVLFLILPPGPVQTMNSPEVQDRMRDECAGSFEQRYQCKENIIVQAGRETFANLALRLGLVLAAPLLAAGFFHTRCRPDPIHHLPLPGDDDATPASPPPASDADDDWKRRAQRHIAHARPPGSFPGDAQ